MGQDERILKGGRSRDERRRRVRIKEGE